MNKENQDLENYNLGVKYEKNKEYEQMKRCYVLAGCVKSFANLGYYYGTIEKDYNQMKKYYDKAIIRGCVSSMNKLAIYYFEKEKNYQKMEKYFLMAIEKGCVDSMNSFGYYYQHVLNDYEQAIKYYIMALETHDYTNLSNFNKIVRDEDLIKYKQYLDIRNSRKLSKQIFNYMLIRNSDLYVEEVLKCSICQKVGEVIDSIGGNKLCFNCYKLRNTIENSLHLDK